MRFRRRLVIPVIAIVLMGLMAPVTASSHDLPLLAWGHGIGGANDSDYGRSIAVDLQGNVLITGHFRSSPVDFDPGPGEYILTGSPSDVIFVAKYDAAGEIVWAIEIGGATGEGRGNAIAVDPLGNVYVTGAFQGTDVDFDPGPGSRLLTSSSSGTAQDIFLAKYDIDGDLVWAFRVGGTGTDISESVAVDSHGNVFVTGDFGSPSIDFDPGGGATTLTRKATSRDIFLAKYDTDGALLWAHNFGGTGGHGRGLAVDAQGNVVLTGEFNGSNVDFDPGPESHPLSSVFGAILLAKYTGGGDLLWAHGFDAVTAYSTGEDVAVDPWGNVYATGMFQQSIDFDPGPDSRVLEVEGNTDIYLAKYTPDGNLLWAHGFGDTSGDKAYGVAADANGYVSLTGYFTGTVDFDPGPGSHPVSSSPGGHEDVFIAKYDAAGSLLWAYGFGSEDSDGENEGTGIAVDGHGAVYATGSFQGTIDIDPGPGSHVLSSTDPEDPDIFFLKLVQPGTTRLAGANRFETAAAVAAHHYPGGASAAFVATGLNFPDALTGAGPAGLSAAPLLLTGSIPPATAGALDALGLSEIIILGGPAAISAADAAALGAWGAVTRLDGPTRYETAIEISKHAYPTGADVVVIATGQNFPDALAAASAATALGGPVLLTPTATLPQAVINEINRLNPSQIIVAGGPVAVSAAVFNQLSGIKPTIRLAGANRYDTAVAISKHTFTNPAVIDHIYVAVGTNFPDALAGAAAAAATGAPVLLTPTASLPQSVIDEIKRLGPARIYILGGTAVISPAVENQLAALLP